MTRGNMHADGIQALGKASYRRSIATAGNKGPKSISFRAATHQDLLNAMRESEYQKIPMILELTKQGLYDPHIFTFIHPQYISWLPFILSHSRKDDRGIDILKGNASCAYRISIEFYYKILKLMEEQPGVFYVR